MEIWKTVEGIGIGYERYSVSTYGRVKTLYKGEEHILTLRNKYKSRPGKAYHHVRFSNQGRLKDFFVHRLVALTFIPNPHNKPLVNHIDGNKFNCRKDNLEWATEQENHDHAVATGLLVYGKCCPIYKITDSSAKEIKILLGQGIKASVLATQFNVSRATIYSIKSGKLWKHID
jgi:hypothetical protein